MSNCSKPYCSRKFFYIIDNVFFCDRHNTNNLNACGIIKKTNGLICGCKSRRSVKGSATCLKHTPKNEIIECCSICLDDCKIGTKPTICGHFFHPECLNKWEKFHGGMSCPLCRTILKNKKIPDKPIIIDHNQMLLSILETIYIPSLDDIDDEE